MHKKINIDEISLEIENSLSSEIKLKQGIFFTKINGVKLMSDGIDFNNVKSVIDTAAGSCNFLLYLADLYPNITFYGIEKNIQVYNQTKIIVDKYKNIKYFLGDAIYDFFDIPKCDLYIGNPPWVNFIDLDKEYRDKIKETWTQYFSVKKDFRMLLGDSRGDLCQLFMYMSIKKYLKDGGRFSVLMPIMSIRSKNSSSHDFREFKNINVTKITEITSISPFENTERSSCFIDGFNEGDTKFPIEYVVFGKDTLTKKLTKKGNNLVFEGDRDILGKSEYVARQGINTLGANDIFIFKSEPKLKSPLIKRLLKSSDIKKWYYKPSYWILLPYEDKKVIDEQMMENNFPQIYEYLNSHRDKLSRRKSKLVKKNFYQLFGVGDYTFKKYKVIWKGLGSKKLECVVVDEETLPNQSMNCYISTDNFDEANYICAVLNSNFFENELLKVCESGSKSFAQPNIMNNFRIKKYDHSNPIQIELSDLSKKFHLSDNKEGDSMKLENLVMQLFEE